MYFVAAPIEEKKNVETTVMWIAEAGLLLLVFEMIAQGQTTSRPLYRACGMRARPPFSALPELIQ
jgi:hypothetical protein